MAVDIEQYIDIEKFIKELAKNSVDVSSIGMLRNAKTLARRDTNKLANTIRRKKGDDEGFVYSVREYATSQEYGLPTGPSQEKKTSEPKNGPGGPYTFTPFFRPTAKKMANDIENDPDTIRLIIRRSLNKSKVNVKETS